MIDTPGTTNGNLRDTGLEADKQSASHKGIHAQRLRLGGRVQGVGFRPFVYRVAHAGGITGWVRNEGGEVEVAAAFPAGAGALP